MGTDYEKWDKQDLINEILAFKRREKYGLVWEDKPEDVVEQCKKKLPVLEEDERMAIKVCADAPTNLIIEGDNYHALSVLNYTHKGMVDVIYIDPPYNRGGDLKYNDSYVGKDDAFRHSKWLSFLSKRLWLAKNLLCQKGVMFISIDDHEQAQLRLLLNQIFGDNNVDVMIWRKSGYGRDGKMKNTSTYRKDHEYVMVCYMRDKKLNKIEEFPAFQNEQKNSDNDPRGCYKAGSISRREDASNSCHVNYYTVTSPSGKKFNRQFDFPIEQFNKLNSDVAKNPQGESVSRIYWGKGRNSVPQIKIFVDEIRSITPYSILLTKGTTTEGTKEVSEILGFDCQTIRPKPVNLIRTLVQLADKKPNLMVLDFFAGSGTTGHAVSALNKRDGGNRRFILCTNNENEIARKVCHPRIKAVMEGRVDDSNIVGLPSNVKYYKTNFVSAERTDANKMKLVQKATSMLCVREGTFELVKSTDDYSIFRDKKRYTGIIYQQNTIDSFKKIIAKPKMDGEFTVYVFSLADDDFSEFFADMPKVIKSEAIPEAILRVYRRLFK